MLWGISPKRRMRSEFYWFTEFCNSQCLSHFAASFIVAQAKASLAESCIFWKYTPHHPKAKQWKNTIKYDAINKCWYWLMKSVALTDRRKLRAQSAPVATVVASATTNDCAKVTDCCFVWIFRVNDPSAGSPTETLLRLLLPLSDKVY